MATNLFRLDYKSEEAFILCNSPEVVRKHYIRLQEEGFRQDAMKRLEQAYNEAMEKQRADCAAGVQHIQ